MSRRETIQLFFQLDVEEYLAVLQQNFGARNHPNQADSYLIDNPELPFYEPIESKDYAFIMGFNYAPLSALLIRALIDHPKLIPADTVVRWLEEQELLLECVLGEVREAGKFT